MSQRQSNTCGLEASPTEKKCCNREKGILDIRRIGRYSLILIIVMFVYVLQWLW